jgi:hypothetical protein
MAEPAPGFPSSAALWVTATIIVIISSSISVETSRRKRRSRRSVFIATGDEPSTSSSRPEADTLR